LTFCATISCAPKSQHESRAIRRGFSPHNCNMP
jgi:hypothetical protein